MVGADGLNMSILKRVTKSHHIGFGLYGGIALDERTIVIVVQIVEPQIGRASLTRHE